MALDFNQAEEQRESLGAIPPNSMVKVQMRIRAPEYSRQGSDPMLTVSKDGNCEMLNCEFVVVSGQFQGKKIWNNFVVAGASDGHKKAAQISMRTMRAIVEAVRGVSPKDASPTATQARMLAAWGDLQGVEFGIVVGIDAPKPGDRWVNNTIKRVVTVDDEQYQHIMSGGEVITDAAIPEIPQAAAATAAPAWAAPKPAATPPTQATLPPAQSWSAPKGQATPPAAQTPPPPANGGMPAWAAPQGGAGNSDHVPF
jgi:hypothetical protein